MLFCIWLLLLIILSVKSIHDVVCSCISFIHMTLYIPLTGHPTFFVTMLLHVVIWVDCSLGILGICTVMNILLVNTFQWSLFAKSEVSGLEILYIFSFQSACSSVVPNRSLGSLKFERWDWAGWQAVTASVKEPSWFDLVRNGWSKEGFKSWMT